MRLDHIIKVLEFIKERNKEEFNNKIFIDGMDVESFSATILIDRENNFCTKNYSIFKEGYRLRIAEVSTGDMKSEDPVKMFDIEIESDKDSID
jgi:hypothetical protein